MSQEPLRRIRREALRRRGWPCPECGGIHFKATCTWERGEWVTDDTWLPYDPPRGRPTGVVTEAECVNCGTVTDLAKHYEWPIRG